MTAVRETASVQVSKPVNGTRRRARGKSNKVPRQRQEPPVVIEPDPLLMAEIKRIRRPGEKLQVVSPTEAWLMPKGGGVVRRSGRS